MRKETTMRATTDLELCDDRWMRRSFFALVLAASATAACSSADFTTAPGDDDTGAGSDVGGDDTSAVDSGRDTSATDTTKDVPGTDTTDSAIEIGPDGDATTTDSGIGEVTSDADSGDVTCADTNVCGGCGSLSGAPGDKCGSCGVLACSGTDLTCSGDHPKNECGGCATLTGHKGDSCCGGGTLGCSSDDNALVCSTSGNSCGGCTVLDHPKDTPCGGVCGTAKYACTSSDTTACSDPVPSTPSLGSPCGTCGTYACNVSGTALVCTGDHPHNACGGCATLSPPKDAACGTCGKETCASPDTTTCTEATPAPLTGCGGQCGTAQYQCTGVGATTCVDPLASPPKPKVGDPCSDCGNYACTGSGASTDVTCVGDPSSASSRCTATHFGCDVPMCSVTGVCSYPPSDTLCTPTTSNPPGCSSDTCTDGATCPPTGDPEPQIKCNMPVSGCTQKLLSDADDDGYSTVAGCFLSKSTTAADCNDKNKYVFPTETTYYPCGVSIAYPTSPPTACTGVTPPPESPASNWDYNCNGTVDREFNVLGGCTYNSVAHTCSTKLGWEGTTIPPCGTSAFYVTDCTYDAAVGGCDLGDSLVTQACR
jgi:hypothetical protein